MFYQVENQEKVHQELTHIDYKMNKKVFKKVLRETKERKERILIEQKMVETRILSIFEFEQNIHNFRKLPKDKQEKLAWALVNEINFLSEKEILNEQLGDFLGKIFGGSLGSVLETILEPLLNSVLSGLGITGFFKNFMISFITTRPGELAKALKDCRTLTTLIANSLGEAMFMMIQEQRGLEGGFYTFIRNALGSAVKDMAFVNKIEDFIGDLICENFSKLSDNAGNVFEKLKGGVTSAIAPATAGK